MSKKYPPQQLHEHVPVLLDAVLGVLDPKPGDSLLDLTAGYGGHARALLGHTLAYNRAVLVDRDEQAHRALVDVKTKGAQLVHSDFLTAAREQVELGAQFDMIMVDLGISSPQIDEGRRGFSFRFESTIDMRMDTRQTLSAGDVINTWSADKLEQIIRGYGEEPAKQTRRIVQAITRARPIATTTQLAAAVASAIASRRGKVHPATRTFQAVRIAVNDELGQLENVLPLLPGLLKPGGRVAIISFHSLEDRLVKRYFAEVSSAGYEAELASLTKKPIRAGTDDVTNPRARSAKLRAAVKK